MRLVLKQSDTLLNKKLNISKRVIPSFDTAWHHHKEIELLYISQSNGIRFVGDHVAPFFPGDLVLVGSHLPHLWRSDSSYYESKSNRSVKTIVSKFTKDFLGADFFKNEEFYKVNKLLEASKFGLCFSKEVSRDLHKEIMKLPELSSIEQHIGLLNILHKLSEVKESKLYWKENWVPNEKGPYFIDLSQRVRNNGSVDGVSSLEGIISVGIGIEPQTQP